jgi:hypothetical protein
MDRFGSKDPRLQRAAGLERAAIEHRARRIEFVLAALRARPVYRHTDLGVTPEGVKHAIADFGGELGEIRRRISSRSAG